MIFILIVLGLAIYGVFQISTIAGIVLGTIAGLILLLLSIGSYVCLQMLSGGQAFGSRRAVKKEAKRKRVFS